MHPHIAKPIIALQDTDAGSGHRHTRKGERVRLLGRDPVHLSGHEVLQGAAPLAVLAAHEATVLRFDEDAVAANGSLQLSQGRRHDGRPPGPGVAQFDGLGDETRDRHGDAVGWIRLAAIVVGRQMVGISAVGQAAVGIVRVGDALAMDSSSR